MTADAGYYRRCWLFSPMLDVAADVSCFRTAQRCDVSYCHRCLQLPLSLLSLLLQSEIDAACHANALDTPLLLSSDAIVADVELA
jgi:hypothetical protein